MDLRRFFLIFAWFSGFSPVVLMAQETMLTRDAAPDVYGIQAAVPNTQEPRFERRWKLQRLDSKAFVQDALSEKPKPLTLVQDELTPILETVLPAEMTEKTTEVVSPENELVTAVTLSERKKAFVREITMLPSGSAKGTLCSCVLFARTLVPELPFGLHDYRSKLNIINSKTPKIGSVAIIKSPSGLGHVAVIKSINEDGSLTIEEGNFRRCRRNIRMDMPENMNIKGYFDPDLQ